MRLPWTRKPKEDMDTEADSGKPGLGPKIVLGAILGLATLSIGILTFLKMTSGPPEPPVSVPNKVSAVVRLPQDQAAPDQPAATPTAPAAPAGSAAPPPEPPAEPVQTTEDRESPPSQPPEGGPLEPAPGPITAGFQPIIPELGQAFSPEATNSDQAGPSSPPAPPAPKKSSPPPVGPVADLPQPRWKVVDEQWDRVNAVESPETDDALDDSGAHWKQINVGQVEKIYAPEEAKPATAAKPVASPTPVKPTAKPRPQTTKPSSGQPAKTASAPTPARKPGEPILAVINESGRPDQGRVYRDVLTAMGYRVDKVEDRPQQAGSTMILYGANFKDKALTLAERLPGRRTLAPQTGKSAHDIVIVVR